MLLCHDPMLVWPAEDEGGGVKFCQHSSTHTTWQGKGYLSRSRYTLNDKDDAERAEGEKENQKHSKEDLRNKNELRDRRNRGSKGKKDSLRRLAHTHTRNHTHSVLSFQGCAHLSPGPHTPSCQWRRFTHFRL